MMNSKLDNHWIVLLILLLLPMYVQAHEVKEKVIENSIAEKADINQFIIKYRDATVKVDSVSILQTLSSFGITFTYHRAMSGHAHVLKTTTFMTESEADILAEKILTSDPAIKYIEADRRVQHFIRSKNIHNKKEPCAK